MQEPGLRSWVAKHSSTYGLLRRLRYELHRAAKELRDDPEDAWRRAKDFAARNPECCEVFHNDRARTIFTSSYRLAALDLGDPRIREGQRILFEAVSWMRRRADAQDVRFIVLLIPTKELVFSEQADDQPSASYHELTEKETRFWKETVEFLNGRAIEFVSGLPALQAQLAVGPQPYQTSADGHPNEQGHQVIAELLSAYLHRTQRRDHRRKDR